MNVHKKTRSWGVDQQVEKQAPPTKEEERELMMMGRDASITEIIIYERELMLLGSGECEIKYHPVAQATLLL